jgi:hypothetical protein
LISCIALSLRQKEGISSRKTHFSHALPTKWGQIFGYYFSVAGQPNNFSSSLHGARIFKISVVSHESCKKLKY